MRSQWECLLQNLGYWQGSFTRLTPQGEIVEDTPSEVILAGLNDNTTIHQTVRRFYDGQPQDMVLEYSSLGRSILFFENGAFSQGSMQLGPYSEFGAELGLIDGDRRLRLVQLFNEDGNLERLTLIREHLPVSNTPERPHLTVGDLLGKWQGEAVTVYPDGRSPDTYPTTNHWQRDGDRLTVTYSLGPSLETATSHARIHGSVIKFEDGLQSAQTVLLPDGASSTCPLHIQAGHPLRLAVSWLLQPDLHQRMLRSYDARGGWVGLTLITERKVD